MNGRVLIVALIALSVAACGGGGPSEGTYPVPDKSASTELAAADTKPDSRSTVWIAVHGMVKVEGIT
jgi:predicted small lipoprotein YifL